MSIRHSTLSAIAHDLPRLSAAAARRVVARPGGAASKGRVLLAALLLCGASAHVVAAPARPRSPDCRVLMTAYTMTTTAASFKATSAATCSFDKGKATASCTIEQRDSTGRTWTSTTETRYRSLDDLIDEAQVVPTLTKWLSSAGTQRAGGATTSGSQVNTYDARGRLLRTDSNPGQPSASKTTFSEWDAAGRPLVARDTGKGFDNRRDIAYDDQVRTRTTRVNGGVVVTVETFDADGNPARQTARGGNSENTSTFEATATQRICR